MIGNIDEQLKIPDLSNVKTIDELEKLAYSYVNEKWKKRNQE